MRFSALATAATAFLSSNNGGRMSMMRLEAGAIEYNWTITHWEAGCARSGCFYLFNISAEAYTETPKAPPFFAYCSGFGEGSPYQQCGLLDEGPAGRRVAARLQAVNMTGTGAHLAVSYQHNDLTQEQTYWNWTAFATTRYNQFVTPPLNFTVTPSEIWGVA